MQNFAKFRISPVKLFQNWIIPVCEMRFEMKHGSLCQFHRAHNSRALLNCTPRLELNTKNRPDNVIVPLAATQFEAMAPEEFLRGTRTRTRPSIKRKMIPSFLFLIFFFLERETYKANINWIFKEFLIPRLIHVNVNIGDISYLSFAFLLYAHFRYIFYNYFIAISFFFTYIKIIIQECVKRVKNREEKNTHILSSFMVERIYVSSIVAVFSNEKEERTFSYGFSKKSFLSKKLKREKYLCSSFQVRWLERGRS